MYISTRNEFLSCCICVYVSIECHCIPGNTSEGEMVFAHKLSDVNIRTPYT